MAWRDYRAGLTLGLAASGRELSVHLKGYRIERLSPTALNMLIRTAGRMEGRAATAAVDPRSRNISLETVPNDGDSTRHA
jgi:hypothetical protein